MMKILQVMKAATAASQTWIFTMCPRLFRHESGMYYVCVSMGGKRTWHSLETRVL